jgi:hypothetical protein
MEDTTLVSQDSQLKVSLLQRGEDTSAIGVRDLKRYYTLLNSHLLEISLTASEASFLCEILKNYRFEDDPDQVKTIWKQIEQGIQQDRLDQKWSVNGEGFVHKLQTLTYLQLIALVDAVERYWIRELSSPHEPIETKLLQVDLLKCCDFAL